MAQSELWRVIAREHVVSLFPVFGLPDATARHGVDLALAIERGNIRWLYHPRNWGRVHRRLVARIRERPQWLADVFKTSEHRGRELVAFARRLTAAQVRRYSNRQLWNVYRTFVRMNRSVYYSGIVAVRIDFQQHTFLSDEVKRFLTLRHAPGWSDLLTLPLRETHNKRQELALLKLHTTAMRYRHWLSSSTATEQLAEQLRARYPSLWRQLVRHARRYAWVHYVYEGPAASPSYFLDMLRDFARQGINPRRKLEQHQRGKITVRQRQRAVERELGPDDYHAWIIALARQAVFYKPYRRELQTWSYYLVEPLLREIGRRHGLALKQVRMMLPAEVRRLLTRGRVDIDVLNQRSQLVVYGRQGRQRFCWSGAAALHFTRRIPVERHVRGVRRLQGTTACAGRARGTARLINSPVEMNKMQPGDILISSATSPNLIPAIRQAAAIVTDEGGLTCHAAIVSRELNIPCVIGTSIATKVIHDGDRVEVDATRGVVRKL